MVAQFVGMICQPTAAQFVPGLCTVRTRVLALLFVVRRRKVSRSARIIVRPLKPKYQVDQILVAELL